MAGSKKAERAAIREALAEAGLEEVDELTLQRLVRVQEAGGTPAEQMRGVLAAFGIRGIDEGTLGQLTAMAARAQSGEQIADELTGSTCPRCGGADVRSCEQESGVESDSVGCCRACNHLWCLECGEPLSRSRSRCANPSCGRTLEWDEELPEEDL